VRFRSGIVGITAGCSCAGQSSCPVHTGDTLSGVSSINFVYQEIDAKQLQIYSKLFTREKSRFL